MKAGTVVKLIDNAKLSAPIGTMGRVVRCKGKKEGHSFICWIGHTTQLDGYYRDSRFVKINYCDNRIEL